MAFPNRGEGGGVPHWGKIPTFSRFFFWGASLSLVTLVCLVTLFSLVTLSVWSLVVELSAVIIGD